MSFTISNKAVASGIVASALLAGLQDQIVSSPLDGLVDVGEAQSFERQPLFTDTELEEDDVPHAYMVQVPGEPEWDDDSQARFEDLVERLAFDDDLTTAELAELDALEALRSITHPSRSYDEIVADHELHRKVNEAIKGLEVFVEYATRTFPAQAHTNRS